MTFEISLLLTSGAVAILAGVLVLTLGSSRPASLLSGFALVLLGLNQLGWARAAYTVVWEGRNQWFELSLGFSMALTLAPFCVAISENEIVRRTWLEVSPVTLKRAAAALA